MSVDAYHPKRSMVNGVTPVGPVPAWVVDRLSMAAPLHLDMARWLLDYELRDDPEAAHSNSLPDALERICQKFFGRLEKVASLAACQALLSRALHIPRAESSFLKHVRAGLGAAPLIDGLAESLQGVDALSARAGIEAVLGTLIQLLMSLIGQDLTLRMLREVWPELPLFVSPANVDLV